MKASDYDRSGIDIAWCPGCGNFSILKIIKQALAELRISPQQLVVSSGIGQAPKTPHYFQTHLFNGLHGRALPVATGIKAANPQLVVIAEGGDGDMYGEGGNHFVHTVRRNPDITHLVHNNMVYGLTKGQASPTSLPGFVTPLQTDGVFQEPFNPLTTAIALNASFVARTFAGAFEESVAIVKEAITHPGYALVDIFQPCVSFNRLNTFQWFKKNSYFLGDDHDAEDASRALQRAGENDPWPLGVFYRNRGRLDYIDHLAPYDGNRTPLHQRRPDLQALARVMDGKRRL